MTALTITHTPADGTLIDGTARNDGSAPILKGRGWRWSRHLGSWYIQRSRDAAPKLATINATADALRAAGFNSWTDRVPYTDIRDLHDADGAAIANVDGARTTRNDAA
ncbi:hypothetical protein [Rhodococcus opacus]|uniref:hypothetical protein n=1 Tax=Rhodococcus opacus TaxID=37919 RepID=UPI0002FAEB95|nr:hypothetical protein [Rhodococcus opacus]AHK35665.1 hypothetical protein Pd630_LPD11090 [Rhodococcus opacus PD630]UDH01141.1 hypothetical protein K2Z90_007584 [Rhodococcus opacus PD630]